MQPGPPEIYFKPELEAGNVREQPAELDPQNIDTSTVRANWNFLQADMPAEVRASSSSPHLSSQSQSQKMLLSTNVNSERDRDQERISGLKKQVEKIKAERERLARLQELSEMEEQLQQEIAHGTARVEGNTLPTT
jgi:hypothetical protein